MAPAAARTLLALVALALPASADVLVVDAAGGGEFTSLVTAVAAAGDGDLLLVRAGDYREFATALQVSGKSLAIVADGSGPVLAPAIQAIAGPGQRVVLRGLTLEPGLHDPITIGLVAAGEDVFVEQCTILGRDGHPAFANAFGGTGLVASGGRLVLVDCLIEGGRGASTAPFTFVSAQPGGLAVDVAGPTELAFHGCTLTGGDGGDQMPDPFGTGPGGSGGDGLSSNSPGLLLVSGGAVTGGDGGDGDQVPGSFTSSTYAAGNGVHLSGTATLTLRDTPLAPGQPGVDGLGQPGFAGAALVAGPGNGLVQHPAGHRALAFGSPASEGGLLQLGYSGEAGDLVGLFLSGGLASPLAVKQGVFHLGSPWAGPFLLGPIAAPGVASFSFAMPNLGLSPDDAVLALAQGVVKPLAGPAVLSAPSLLVVVDNGL